MQDGRSHKISFGEGCREARFRAAGHASGRIHRRLLCNAHFRSSHTLHLALPTGSGKTEWGLEPAAEIQGPRALANYRLHLSLAEGRRRRR